MRIETPRLVLRPARLADAPDLFAFLGDPAAMRFTHVDATQEDCRRRIMTHEWRRGRDGYAPWTVIRKADGRIIGWGGLYDDPFDPGWGCELGYFFHPDAWGKGFGSELVAAALEHADRDLALCRTSAFAHPANAGSRRLLEKAGFVRQRFVPAMNRHLYARSRPVL